jgi:outer membrane lipoprotein-sorting protein
MYRIAALVTPVVLCALVPALPATTAEDILSRMDQAAPKFTGMQAGLNRVSYTKVIDDKTTETGTIAIRKAGARDLQVLVNITTPDEKKVAFGGRKAEIFYPKLKTVQIYDLGKQGELVDQFMLLGFGASGRELKESYTVKYGGADQVAGETAHKLELTPKSAKLKENITRIDLWIVDSGAYPVQQQFVQPSGDYYLFTYSSVKQNPGLTAQQLQLQLPKGVKKEYPQK